MRKKQNIITFREAAGYINDIPRFATKNTMEDTRAFLHRLGDPDRKMRVIHVAGTNGKGSVCAYLRSILEAAGYRVALFTSPHLVQIRERFVVDGEMISEEDFLRAFLHIYDMLDWDGLESGREDVYHPSYFEYLFFIAMVLFPEKSPDFCILETGVGGRLDATNSVSGKELSVITHISLDHVKYLGDTVEKIAREKAGIMQAGAPAVYWDTCCGTTDIFRQHAEEIGISAYSVSENDYYFSNFKRKTIDFCVHTKYYRDVNLTLDTIAAYQMENCALAVRAIEVLDQGRTITGEQIRRGVRACHWAGRMEEVLSEVYVDGAHNEDGIRAFLETVKADGRENGRSLLFSVLEGKDALHMTEKLVDSALFDRIVAAHIGDERALPGERLADLFGRFSECDVKVYEDVASAFCALLGQRKSQERIYVAGSLYLVGEIKELLNDDKFRRRIEEISAQPGSRGC